MQHLLETLAALPPSALLGAMTLLAAVENIFPPIPADVLVAFGGFLAARQSGSPWPAFLCVWGGNIAGAVLMYFVGRRFGASWVERKFHLTKDRSADQRILTWYERYGALSLFASRFVPAVRAVVPPLAGALRIPAGKVAVAIAAASGIWYGIITWLAFTAGSNWDTVMASVERLGKWTALGATGLVVVIGLVLWLGRRRR